MTNLANRAGLLITTAISTAAIQNTTWDIPERAILTGMTIAIAAFFTFAGSIYDK